MIKVNKIYINNFISCLEKNESDDILYYIRIINRGIYFKFIEEKIRLLILNQKRR